MLSFAAINHAFYDDINAVHLHQVKQDINTVTTLTQY